MNVLCKSFFYMIADIVFTNFIDANPNRKRNLGGSITLDVGVYTIQFCQLAFKQEPKQVKAKGIVNDEGIDVEVSAELHYGNNKVAKIRISALNTYENSAKIIGTKGTITVKFVNFMCLVFNFFLNRINFICFRFRYFGVHYQ